MPHIKNALIRYRIIDKCLRNKYRPYPTKRDLREACEESLFGASDGVNICDSTIEKDMFAMKMEHDAPIKYSKRHGGYYYEDPDFSINDIPLNDEDLGAIKFALSTLMQFREVELFKQFGNAIDKIVDRISITTDPNNEDVGKYVHFETALSNGGSEFLNPLLVAIRKKSLVTFSYSSFISGENKPRKCLPLLLKEYRNRWYLISYDTDKSDIITYALDRMINVELTGDLMDLPVEFDVNDYFKFVVGISVDNKSKPEQVRLKSNAVATKYIESQPFHVTQKITKFDDHAIIQMEVMVSEELIRTILSFGPEIEVLSPDSLKIVISERVSLMNSYYSSHKP